MSVRLRGPAAVLALAACAHFLHDGFADVLVVLYPLWAVEFGLTLAQVGALRTAYTGAMALGQVPAGMLAERWGERSLLALGTAITAASFVVLGRAWGFATLGLVLASGGLASSVQHPIASSLVARAWPPERRRGALGTYNFSGDLGKMAVPVALGVGVGLVGWRSSAAVLGLVGLGAAAALALALMRLPIPPGPAAASGDRPATGWGLHDPRGFWLLAALAMIDTGTRSAFLTFLPFALLGKGAGVATIGTALGLLFAGGATGKLVCGFVAERVGVIRAVLLTEVVTVAGMLLVVAAPLPLALASLPVLGVALNGTSSVLHGTVADFVGERRRARAYGLYYTLSLGASALAPPLSGAAGDLLGVGPALVGVALVVTLTLPLALMLRPRLTRAGV